MRRTNAVFSMVVRGLLILALTPGWVLEAGAQSPAAKQKALAVKPTAPTAKVEPVRTGEPAAQPPGSTQEGIKVHGHWVIEVRNPDGSLSSRAEFENALTDNGKGVLGQLLAKKLPTTFQWVVNLFDSATLPPYSCRIPGGLEFGCTVDEFHKTLTVDFIPPTAANAGGCVLSGFVQAIGDLTIVKVHTLMVGASPPLFTETTLPTPQRVLANQIVQVTVTFTFS